MDLETESFYEVRRGLIEALLEKIEHGMAWRKSYLSCHGNHMPVGESTRTSILCLSCEQLYVTCIGGPCLAPVCLNLAQDYRSWSSGMPDLLLWRFRDDYRGEAKLVEVKGPRDRLSEQQRAWLLFLIDCGFNVEVCKVSHAPV